MRHDLDQDDIDRVLASLGNTGKKYSPVQELRRQFLAQPPARQAETRERVTRLLIAERLAKRNQPSYLAQHAKEIYGA